MPQFTTTTLEEAYRLAGGGKREKELAAYLESVNGLAFGTAVKVVPSDGESLSTVRRRLGDAVRRSGRYIQIERIEDAVYFWLKERRRPGRPRSRRQ